MILAPSPLVASGTHLQLLLKPYFIEQKSLTTFGLEINAPIILCTVFIVLYDVLIEWL